MVSPDYLLRHVAKGDGRPDTAATTGGPSPPLTRYYAGDGYPPGRWLGSGLKGLGDSVGISVGSEVTEEQMYRLFRDRLDLATGLPLLRQPPRSYLSRTKRVEKRIAALVAKHPDLSAVEIGEYRTKFRAEERSRGGHAVLGFDLTFKPPKSVSVLWGVADHGIQVQLYEAHQEAVEATLRVIEAAILRTRTGHDGVRHIATRGLVAAAFDHWDSRKGDPLLHTHVTVANAVQGVDDGIWRTIDSRGLFKATVAASETYQVLVADAVTRRLGIGWERRQRPGANRNAARELASVPGTLVDEFSQRSAAIEAVVDESVQRYKDTHGGQAPSQSQLWRMRQAIVLDTRTAKHVSSLAEATDRWRARAADVLGLDTLTWAREAAAAATPAPALLTPEDIAPADRKAMAARVVDVVSGKRAVWGRWNLHAEAMRQIASAGWQFTTAEGAWQVGDAMTAQAAAMSLAISAPELASVPTVFRNVDGTSQFTGPMLYSSADILAAEDRLIGLASDTSGPAIAFGRAQQLAATPLPGRRYALDTEDQAPAAIAVTTSGRVVDVLEGPAGTGKTTTMAGVRAIWEAEHGPGSVAGLAPSSKAAEVLAADLGITTDNTAQWLAQQAVQPARADRITDLEQRLAHPDLAAAVRAAMTRQLETTRTEYRRWALAPGQLLIVDEAGMTGTFALDRLASQAAEAGAKLLLIGDPKQLSAVEVGGAFGMLTAARQDTPRLSVIRRFTDDDGARRRWEEAASMAVRVGDIRGARPYFDHERVQAGAHEEMLDAAYRAWRTDITTGRAAILIAGDNATVTDLNTRARADLVTDGTVTETGIELHDGTWAGAGDRIVTREINRWIGDGSTFTPTGRTGKRADGFVRNGQQWIVQSANRDGSLTVRLAATDRTAASTAASITLPADYVARAVELAYATTAHRSQGMTVDCAHTLADAATQREVLYVALTRGRRANTMYLVGDDKPATAEHTHGPVEPADAQEILDRILRNTAGATSAHETIAAEQDRAGSLAQLAAEYETLAAYGHDLAAVAIVEAAHLPVGDALIADPNFAAIAAACRAAHRAAVPTSVLVDALTGFAAAPAVDAIAAELRSAARAAAAGRPSPTRRYIAGIVPDATAGITDRQVLTAMGERARLMDARIEALLGIATVEPPVWAPARPADPAGVARWRHAMRETIAYRDRWQVPSDQRAPLGDAPCPSVGVDRHIDYRRVSAALEAITPPPIAEQPTAYRPNTGEPSSIGF